MSEVPLWLGSVRDDAAVASCRDDAPARGWCFIAVLPQNQRQHRTLHIQKDELPFAVCSLLCPASVALRHSAQGHLTHKKQRAHCAYMHRTTLAQRLLEMKYRVTSLIRKNPAP